MNTTDLGGPLLASVSRSFYLSIRILPKNVRAPVGLAYLLARASDTIADCSGLPVAVRLRCLEAFLCMVHSGSTDGLASIQEEIRSADPGEQNLIAQLPACLQWLQTLDGFDRDEILRVLPKIIEGQRLDLERFRDSQAVTALESATVLDTYTYLVAGCVGEFWTRVCLRHVPKYATLQDEALCKLGIGFGKGLQLVNILRDMPADLRAGRCYLPGDELAQLGLSPESLLANPIPARPLTTAWLNRASEHMEIGFQYIRGLRSPRLRAACVLPWHLGVKTIELMRITPPLETQSKVKVPRSTVYRALGWAFASAYSNTALEHAAKPTSRSGGISFQDDR